MQSVQNHRGEGQGEEIALRLILRAQRRVFPSNSHRPRIERACSRQCIEPLSPRHGAVAYLRGDIAPREPRHQLGAAARRRLRPRYSAHRHQGTPIHHQSLETRNKKTLDAGVNKPYSSNKVTLVEPALQCIH